MTYKVHFYEVSMVDKQKLECCSTGLVLLRQKSLPQHIQVFL